MVKRLRYSIGWGAVGSAVYAGCQWGMLIALAHFGTLYDVGVLTLSLAVLSPIFLLAGMNLRVAQATDVADAFSYQEYAFVRLATTLVGTLTGVTIILTWAGLRAQLVTAILVCLVKALEALTDVYIGKLQQAEKIDSIGKLQIVRGLAGLVGFVGGLALTSRLEAAVMGWLFGWLCVFLAVDARVLRGAFADRSFKLFGGEQTPRLKTLFVAAFPLGLIALMDSLIVNVPKYALKEIEGIEAVGVFSAVVYVLVVGNVVVGSIGLAVMPRLARLACTDTQGFRKLLTRTVLVTGSIGVAALVAASAFGSQILMLLYSSAFAGYGDLFVVIMAAGLLWYTASPYGWALNSLRQFKAHSFVYGLSFVVVVMACALIPSLGLLGAAVAVALGMLTRLLASVVAVRLIVIS